MRILTFVSRRRIARVFFGRRSNGIYFFFLYISRIFWRVFRLITVFTLAIDFRRVLLRKKVRNCKKIIRNILATYSLVNLAADPPAIFCTRKSRSSRLSSTKVFIKSLFDLSVDHHQLSDLDIKKISLGCELIGLNFWRHL